ncbi:tRNA m(1)G methyltransferase, putative [Plasmodium gallinaceum]|uniref:tRNA (guanine(9)-N(1))-methyltransferase n=1 Tax=Plasmodium gallinaceum TaxID=5849 RepID=A0A1J1GUQ2_PLAGA|nr:tRNA m(1)G methyltransferase, putative [Plasmodium gallinaceum]CRG96239.1 tRNA m(1)G methyltransferase, putative [Plasmodium gallinaceum]
MLREEYIENNEEINDFFYNLSNVIDENDIKKLDKNRKTKREKKKDKRELLKEKRKKNRPEEKKRKKNKRKEELLKILNDMNEEEKIAYLKERKILEKKMKEKKREFLLESFTMGYKICFNCNFQNYMEEKEISSLAKQIFLSYHYMTKNNIPIQFHFTSLNNNDSLFSYLKKYSINKWKVHKHTENYWDIFSKEKIVVLSPDAIEELEEVKKDEVYIIAALVDRSVSKNLSFYEASSYGFVTKKLPLEKYIKKKKSNVLNVNTVVEILINYIKIKNWKKVFEICIPQKKVLCFCHELSQNENKNINIYNNKYEYESENENMDRNLIQNINECNNKDIHENIYENMKK